MIGAAITALGAGLKLALSIFTARNSPAMQANAQAQTIANIHASAAQHLASGNLAAAQADVS
jgi:hypothetical protein